MCVLVQTSLINGSTMTEPRILKNVEVYTISYRLANKHSVYNVFKYCFSFWHLGVIPYSGNSLLRFDSFYSSVIVQAATNNKRLLKRKRRWRDKVINLCQKERQKLSNSVNLKAEIKAWNKVDLYHNLHMQINALHEYARAVMTPALTFICNHAPAGNHCYCHYIKGNIVLKWHQSSHSK